MSGRRRKALRKMAKVEAARAGMPYLTDAIYRRLVREWQRTPRTERGKAARAVRALSGAGVRS